MKPPRRKFTPCWAVIRLNPAHVLAVFEYLDQAEIYAEKVQADYNTRELDLSVQVQPSDYCHF